VIFGAKKLARSAKWSVMGLGIFSTGGASGGVAAGEGRR